MALFAKKIGVWGLGVVGRAAIRFLSSLGCEISVCDTREISEEDRQFILAHNAIFYRQPAELQDFFNANERILFSGGVDVRPHAAHAHKWLPEIDLFYMYAQAPIIAITGSVGKTTVTHYISELLQRAGKRVITAGNIGVGLGDIVSQKPDYFVLEVSSFQLEHCSLFRPHIAIITNLIPNHLDRHGTVQDYWLAKARLLQYQQEGDSALLDQSCLKFLGDQLLGNQIILGSEHACVKDNLVYLQGMQVGPEIPAYGFPANWLAAYAVLARLGLPINPAPAPVNNPVLEHRLEHVAVIDRVDYVNDSKSTLMQTTAAALKCYEGRRVHLLLGGLSKGVDRTQLMGDLASATCIYAFGAEAESLAIAASRCAIAAQAFATLEDAFAAAQNGAQAGDVVLLSPSGSSYDLFTDYRARGKRFKELVVSIKAC